MKIYLADLLHNGALGDNQISGGNDYVVPLNIASVSEFIESILGDNVEITLYKYLDDLLDAIALEAPGILGLSNYIWNIDINEKAIDFMTGKSENTVIVMGGPAISPNPPGIEEFLLSKTGLDAHIMLEGERPFLSLVQAVLKGGKDFLQGGFDLPGCAYLVDRKLVFNNLIQDGNIPEFKSPYLTGKLDVFLERGLIPLFESNRGCPFQCTFCAWGISALNKVRKFDIDRVFAEMEYCANKFPEMTSWIIADANFGMLKRDVKIAQKLKEIKARNPALKNILLWESKNTSERNLEIARIIGNDLGNVLVAVQTLDEQAQKFVKRDNIHLDDVPRKIKIFHESGALVETHVLSALPGETYQAHIETLRKCFNIGFDFINVFSTLLVKGSEMEYPESVSLYKIGTKFRLREGSYGEYRDIKSIECEEIIRSNSTIDENETLSLRPVHWLIWYGWNHGFLKPILKMLHQKYDHNPIDVLLKIANGDKSNHPIIHQFFDDFLKLAESEWFDSREAFEEHYLQQGKWDDLVANGFSKVEFISNAKLILSPSTYDALLAYLIDLLSPDVQQQDLDEIITILRALRVEPEKIINTELPIEQRFTISRNIARYFDNSLTPNTNETTPLVQIILSKSLTDQGMIKESMQKYNYDKDPLYALRKTLGANSSAFLYDLQIT